MGSVKRKISIIAATFASSRLKNSKKKHVNTRQRGYKTCKKLREIFENIEDLGIHKKSFYGPKMSRTIKEETAEDVMADIT